MMFAINKNNFEDWRDVTCNSCHRGSPLPAAVPGILSTGQKPEVVRDEQGMSQTSMQSGAIRFWPSSFRQSVARRVE